MKPEKYNMKLTIAAAVLLLAGLLVNDPLGWFVFNYENADNLIEDIHSDQIESIVVARGSTEKLVFTRTSDGWQVKEPAAAESYRADEKKISDSIEKLLSIKRFRDVSSNKEKQIEYQVDETGFNVILKGTDKALATIYLGKAGSVWNSTLVRLKDEDTVYSARGTIKNDWNHDADYFRDKNLLAFIKENVTSYEVKGPQNYTVYRNDLGNWMLKTAAGAEYPAKKAQAENSLSQLSKLEGNGFLKKEDSIPPDYGTILVGFSNGQKQVLEIKGPDKDNNYVVKSSFNNNYMTISRYKIDGILINEQDMRDKDAENTTPAP